MGGVEHLYNAFAFIEIRDHEETAEKEECATAGSDSSFPQWKYYYLDKKFWEEDFDLRIFELWDVKSY